MKQLAAALYSAAYQTLSARRPHDNCLLVL
jgi:hypothetical protein